MQKAQKEDLKRIKSAGSTGSETKLQQVGAVLP
jgi:hypothetical protein